MSKYLTKTGQQRVSFGELDPALAYKLGDSVIYEGNVWIANDDIPPNTPFTPGTTGATWSSKVAGIGEDGLGNLSNGTSNLVIAANGNITMSSAGNANILTVTSTGANISGTLGISGVTTLGPVGNVIITGGSDGQILRTNGNGTLSWITNQAQQLVNGNSNVVVAANSSVTVGVRGNANILTVTGTGANIAGTLGVTGSANVGNLGTGNLTVSGVANLGPIANVIITGGAPGQLLQTNGNGVLSWSTSEATTNKISNGNTNITIPSANSNISIVVANSNVATISNTDVTLSTNLTVSGNLQVDGNITYINSNVVTINDKNIVLANNAANAAAANGGGFTINGANVVFDYNSTANTMNLTHSLVVAGNITANYVDGELVGATHTVARNTTGNTITKGQVVYVTGASGNNLTVGLATNATEAGSSTVIGLAHENIANGSTGLIATGGALTGLDTSALTEGALLFLGVDGAVTAVEPVAPAHLVIVGYVERSHPTVGSIYIDVRSSWELGELHGVKLTSLVDSEILAWDSANSLWVNGTLDRGNY